MSNFSSDLRHIRRIERLRQAEKICRDSKCVEQANAILEAMTILNDHLILEKNHEHLVSFAANLYAETPV